MRKNMLVQGVWHKQKSYFTHDFREILYILRVLHQNNAEKGENIYE